jgi:hypothetical protein
MLYREVITVCSETHTKHVSAMRVQKVEFLDIKPAGKHSNHWTL